MEHLGIKLAYLFALSILIHSQLCLGIPVEEELKITPREKAALVKVIFRE
jgi:hypothetical protein